MKPKTCITRWIGWCSGSRPRSRWRSSPGGVRHRVAERGVEGGAGCHHHWGWMGVRAGRERFRGVRGMAGGQSVRARIPLGRDDEAPEFRTSSWIAMMFSAGMGIGLMFYGVAEPLAHFEPPPPGTAAPGSPEAFDIAMATTLFHWTLHPWAIYAVVGLAIAYGQPPRAPAAAELGVHPAVRPQAGRGWVWPRRGHLGDLRDAVRVGRVARPGRAADRRRPHRGRLHGRGSAPRCSS